MRSATFAEARYRRSSLSEAWSQRSAERLVLPQALIREHAEWPALIDCESMPKVHPAKCAWSSRTGECLGSGPSQLRLGGCASLRERPWPLFFVVPFACGSVCASAPDVRASRVMHRALDRAAMLAMPTEREESGCGAGSGTRTHTLLRAADFESAASTDSAIPARAHSIAQRGSLAARVRDQAA